MFSTIAKTFALTFLPTLMLAVPVGAAFAQAVKTEAPYAYKAPEMDSVTIKLKLVSNAAAKCSWALKPKPGEADITKEAKTGAGTAPAAGAGDWQKYMPKEASGAAGTAAGGADWQKYTPKDPVCETQEPQKPEDDKVDTWTIEGWAPVSFVYKNESGEFPISTEFVITPNTKEVRLESSGSIGSSWDLKSAEGLKPSTKPYGLPADAKSDVKAEKKPPIVGQPTVAVWSLGDLEAEKENGIAVFAFNFRGKELTTVEVQLAKKKPAEPTAPVSATTPAK